MTTRNRDKFFIPTKQEIEAVVPGSMAPNFIGKLAEVTKVTAKGPDMYGKWFVCYYVKFGKMGAISHSLKEDKLDRSLPLCNTYTSAQLDDIEKDLLATHNAPF